MWATSRGDTDKHLSLTATPKTGVRDGCRLSGVRTRLTSLASRPGEEGDLQEWLATLDLTAAPPVWANREARDGDATAYVCRGRACSPPRESLFEALTWTPGE